MPRAPVGEGWSGRRGSNPRPTAWKAVTLPLSYSRLRASRSGGQAPRKALSNALSRRGNKPTPRNYRTARRAACRQNRQNHQNRRSPCHATRLRGFGGEGRVRTSVATRAADLQSAAIDRSATSPNLFTLWPLVIHLCTDADSRPCYPFPERQLAVLESVCSTRILRENLSTGFRNRRFGAPPDVARWSWRRDLNPRPADYKSAALPD